MANVLLVDDDADLLKLLSMRLQAAGHRVTAVESAEAALTQLAVTRPQLVVSDVRLPGATAWRCSTRFVPAIRPCR